MNLDPLFNKLEKHLSDDKENPDKEITRIEDLFKKELRDDFDVGREEPASMESRQIGDLNNDGKIDFDDLLVLKDILEGKFKPDEKELKFADLNRDGIVDYKDLNLMINLVIESKRAEDQISALQGVYNELTMKSEQGLANSDVDKVKINTVKDELEEAIAQFILQKHNTN